jgi:hypothetical protein
MSGMARLRWWWTAAGLLVSAVLVGQGVFFARVGLEDADQWASVIGSFVGLIGLVVSVAALVVSLRSTGQERGTGQHAGRVAGDNYQAGSVAGAVRIGRRRGRPISSSGRVSSATPTGSGGGQSVGSVGGDNVQLGSVGEDLQIDRD